ncbi:hypothetical protein PENSPDRAFT_655681 [Peniophora sp. CONT]|nr:hypothetical protein PENSPDRAFT_655681 [Peniophora sp. CONT]
MASAEPSLPVHDIASPVPEIGTASNQAPACPLPEDTLALVFFELLWSCAPYQRHAPPPVLSPSHVCRLWRRAAIANKRLWSYIPLSSPEFAALFMRRSYPIDVSVYIPQNRLKSSERRRAAVEEITRYPARIRVLVSWAWGITFGSWQGHAPHNFADSPKIEVLGLYKTDIDTSAIVQLSTCVKLRSLTLSQRCCINFAEPVALPNITSLCIHEYNFDLPSFQKLLHCLPALEVLVLYRAEFYRQDPDTSSPSLPSSLNTLHLASSSTFIMHFLGVFSIPDRTSVAVHFLDGMAFNHHKLEDPGPPAPDMPILSRIFHQGGRTEQTLPWMTPEVEGLDRVMASFQGDTLLTFRPHGKRSVEVHLEDRPLAQCTQETSTRAPCSIYFHHPDAECMSMVIELCLLQLDTSKLCEIYLEDNLRTLVVESILNHLTQCAAQTGSLPSLKRLHICISKKRLDRRTLGNDLTALAAAWPTLQVTTLVTDSDDGDHESESDEDEDDNPRTVGDLEQSSGYLSAEDSEEYDVGDVFDDAGVYPEAWVDLVSSGDEELNEGEGN